MHVAVGRYLAEDNPVVLRALQNHRVTLVGVLISNFVNKVLKDPPNAIFLSVNTFLIPFVIQELHSHGLGGIPLLAGLSSKDTHQRAEFVKAGYDDVVNISQAPHHICEDIERIINEHTPGSATKKTHVEPILPIDYRDETDRRITELVALGRTDRDIADTLFLAEHTIRNRLSRLMTRSEIMNRTQLALVFHQEMTHHLIRRVTSDELE